ncbi:MAG: hypothetical protein NC041_00820 [Bacteroides sp.]|nr:hypothetical protein [Prevotella sp.]MCM1408020.1 hypothetical protein [Treponema brennaborense]MCM1468996.1 hypothetical protein [Bacteroides sp.]
MMKKHFLPKTESPACIYVPLAIWCLLYAAVIIIFVCSLFRTQDIHIDSNLADILPPSHALKNVASADAAFSSKNARSIVIFSAHRDFSAAKAAMEKLYNECKHESFFESIMLYADASAAAQISDFLFEWRYNLIDDETAARLERGEADKIAQEALAAVFGGFAFSDFSHLEEDPFLLTDKNMRIFLNAALMSGAGLFVKDGVLAANHEGIWYVMLRGVLSEKSTSVANKQSAVKYIYKSCAEIQENAAREAAYNNGTAETNDAFFAPEFFYTGIPFHSYESSSSAQKEISIISSIAMVLVICIFLCVFRSLFPAFVSAFAVLLSCVFACVSALLIFRKIHLLTFVFGTTLIGTCLDYSIHFFAYRKDFSVLKNGGSIRSHIFRGIGISFLSTEICCAALALAPFPLLKQVAVFLAAGLLCAFSCVVCVYPCFENRAVPKRKYFPEKFFRLPLSFVLRKNIFFAGIKKTVRRFRLSPRMTAALPAAAALIVLLCCKNSVRIENNIRNLYKMPEHLLRSERTASEIFQTKTSGWYFLIEGISPNDVLLREEQLCRRIAEELPETDARNYAAVSRFIPSEQKQRRSYAAAQQLLPATLKQYEALGFSAAEEKELRRGFESAAGKFCPPPNSSRTNFPDVIAAAVDNLWIGQCGELYYSCVMPFSSENEDVLRSIAETEEHVYFVNKSKDINKELDSLTAAMLKLLALAFAVITAMLVYLYPLKTALSIAAAPLFAGLITAAVLAACGAAVGFFSATGFVLVFGLGLDYIIYNVEGRKSDAEKTTRSAVLLSYITTALSFGALSLTGFAPVHIFGLTVCVGLTAAFVFPLLLASQEKE